MLDEYRTPYVFFLDKLQGSDVLTEKVIDLLIGKYVEVHTIPEIRELTFSKLTPEEPLLEDDTGLLHWVMEDCTPAYEGLVRLNEHLFDRGYPDGRKIEIDFSENDPERDVAPDYRVKSVGFVRRRLT